MKCKTCIENFEKYLEGKLPEGTKKEFRAHLAECADCHKAFSTLLISEKYFKEEKQIVSNPFLSTRIMAKIEALEAKAKALERVPVYSRVLKPVLVAASIVIAVFLGITAGNLYQPLQSENSLPEEAIYFDDAGMENLAYLLTE